MLLKASQLYLDAQTDCPNKVFFKGNRTTKRDQFRFNNFNSGHAFWLSSVQPNVLSSVTAGERILSRFHTLPLALTRSSGTVA